MIDRKRDAVGSERDGEKEGEPAKSANLVHSSFRLEQDVISELQKAVVSILMPNHDTQLCPYGTTSVSSETAETPQILCMSIS